MSETMTFKQWLAEKRKDCGDFAGSHTEDMMRVGWNAAKHSCHLELDEQQNRIGELEKLVMDVFDDICNLQTGGKVTKKVALQLTKECHQQIAMKRQKPESTLKDLKDTYGITP